jgi:adenylate kinase family enzyme
MVAVLGPPGAGKSTLTAALTDGFGCAVVRLRELAHRDQNRPGMDRALFASTDPLGWLPETTVNVLLRRALLGHGFTACGMVVLENLPGSLAQAMLLRRLAREAGARLAAVELVASDAEVSLRVRQRRVCPVCEPDPRGDPHRPAAPRADAPERCARCAGVLSVRPSDATEVFTARLGRYRDRIGTIRAGLQSAGVVYVTVDGATDADTVREKTITAVGALTGREPRRQPTPSPNSGSCPPTDNSSPTKESAHG